jgi:hypothetical protein
MDCSEIVAANDQVLYSEAGICQCLFFVPTEQRPSMMFLFTTRCFYANADMYILYRRNDVISPVIQFVDSTVLTVYSIINRITSMITDQNCVSRTSYYRRQSSLESRYSFKFPLMFKSKLVRVLQC